MTAVDSLVSSSSLLRPWTAQLAAHRKRRRSPGTPALHGATVGILHGNVFRIRLGRHVCRGSAHPELMQHVLLTKRQNFVKGRVLDSLRAILGDGLVTLEGEAWKERRTLALPAFHRQSLEKVDHRHGPPVARGTSSAWRARLGPIRGELDVHPEFVRLTLDVVISALFGEGTIDGNEISYEALGCCARASERQRERRPAGLHPHAAQSETLAHATRAQSQRVHGHRQGRRSSRPGTARSSRCSSRRATTAAPRSPTRPFATAVITHIPGRSRDHRVDLVWLFVLLDGRPTSSRGCGRRGDQSARPGRESDLRRRSQARLSASGGGRDPAIPAGGADGRPQRGRGRPARRLRHRSRGYRASVHLGRAPSPGLLDRPRAIRSGTFCGGTGKLRHKWSYLPFSGGPRVCIGNAFSLIETVVLIAQILNRFDIEVQSCADVKPVAVATVRPDRPVRVKFKPRPG